jgi:monoterpene epsilon-lactone hydrolase
MGKIIWIGIVAFVGGTLRRLRHGPASPGWSWKLEWIVAVQRAVLTAMIDWPPSRVREVTVGRMGARARALELEDEKLGGVPCERYTRPGEKPNRHLLYIHGGGFAVGSVSSHRELVATIAAESGVCAHSVAYRQPPEDRFPAAVDDVVAAYRGLLASGVAPESVAIAGDSAGGNLCLALMLRAKADGFPLPASAVLICPAPDLTLPGASWNAEPLLDYLTRPIAKAWLDHYVDSEQISDPFASPIRGDLRGLPPILMHAGSNEGLIDEIEILADALRQAGTTLTYQVVPEMPHVWHLFVGLIPEAETSLREIATFVKNTTRDPNGEAR